MAMDGLRAGLPGACAGGAAWAMRLKGYQCLQVEARGRCL
ncbi:hypothetical protein S1OALGB6SA_2409 [Olavius algarvensis spirochete endosymbiont]|nr:hypothetical protein S1OALGB6SA_2409 [Olavius algarvensis spirochete endosymbiont]